MVSSREHVSSGSTTNLACLHGFRECFNVTNSVHRDEHGRGHAYRYQQATEAGALGEKDANCCPAEMAPNQEVLGPEQGLLSL